MVGLDCFGLMRKSKRRRRSRGEGAASLLLLLASGFFNGGKKTLIAQEFEEGIQVQEDQTEGSESESKAC